MELYEEFPTVPLQLIEPLSEYEPFLKRIASKYGARYVLACAGEKKRMAVLNVHPDKMGSSLLHEVEGEAVDGKRGKYPW